MTPSSFLDRMHLSYSVDSILVNPPISRHDSRLGVQRRLNDCTGDVIYQQYLAKSKIVSWGGEYE